MRRALLVLPLAAVLLGSAGCAAAEVHAPVPATSAAVPRAELLRRQERLGVVARAIQDLVDPNEGPTAKPLPSGENRYGEVRIDSERDVVELWWAGPLPEEARAVLRSRPDIAVEVHRARYSNNELHVAGDRIAELLTSGALGADVTVDSIDHDVRAGRLHVRVLDPHDRWTVAALHRRLDPVTPVPFDVVRRHEPSLHDL